MEEEIDLEAQINDAAASLASTLFDIASSGKTREEMDSEFRWDLEEKIKAVSERMCASFEDTP